MEGCAEWQGSSLLNCDRLKAVCGFDSHTLRHAPRRVHGWCEPCVIHTAFAPTLFYVLRVYIKEFKGWSFVYGLHD